MDKGLIYVSTVGMSYDDWLSYRYTGIGASEVATVMGLDQYKSPAELFNEKIGNEVRPTIQNMAMFNGRHMEAFVADYWTYWDGDEASLMRNKDAGTRVRKMRKINAYVRNPKYPQLFVSLDRVINKHGNKDEGALEIKTIGGWSVNQWEGGIKPAHIVQVQTQCGVCGFKYGELATMVDGRKFEVYPFDFMPDVFESVLDLSSDFWKRVVKGRALIGQKYEAIAAFDIRASQDIQLELNSLEPAPEAGEAYRDFLAAKYRDELPGLSIDGTDDMLLIAQEHKTIGEKIDLMSERRSLCENKLKNFMEQAVELNFRAAGKVTWKQNVKGVRVFRNLTK